MSKHSAEEEVESMSQNSTNQNGMQKEPQTKPQISKTEALEGQHCSNAGIHILKQEKVELMDTLVTLTDQELECHKAIETDEYDSDVQLIAVVPSSPIIIEDDEGTNKN